MPMVYEAPQPHVCETWMARGAVGSIWRCPDCNWHWINCAPGLLSGGWYPVSRRKQRKLKRETA